MVIILPKDLLMTSLSNSDWCFICTDKHLFHVLTAVVFSVLKSCAVCGWQLFKKSSQQARVEVTSAVVFNRWHHSKKSFQARGGKSWRRAECWMLLNIVYFTFGNSSTTLETGKNYLGTPSDPVCPFYVSNFCRIPFK